MSEYTTGPGGGPPGGRPGGEGPVYGGGQGPPSSPPPPPEAPPPREPSGPVFTSRRRERGPGWGPVLGVIALVLFVAVVVAAWFRYGGLGGPGAATDVPADTLAEAPPDTAPPPPPPPVRLAITVEPAAAAVTVDDTLPVTDAGVTVAVGPHRVHAEAAGYLTLDTVVELAADSALALSLTRAPPTTGTLAVRANLPGRVLVNGRDRGAAPVSGLRLRPGSYTVRFVPEGAEGLAEERAVRVRAGQASSTSFQIEDALLSVGVRQPRWATVYDGDARIGDTPIIEHRLPARVYTVRVARDGYITQERLVRLEPGEHYQWVDIVLEPAVTP